MTQLAQLCHFNVVVLSFKTKFSISKNDSTVQHCTTVLWTWNCNAGATVTTSYRFSDIFLTEINQLLVICPFFFTFLNRFLLIQCNHKVNYRCTTNNSNNILTGKSVLHAVNNTTFTKYFKLSCTIIYFPASIKPLQYLLRLQHRHIYYLVVRWRWRVYILQPSYLFHFYFSTLDIQTCWVSPVKHKSNVGT